MYTTILLSYGIHVADIIVASGADDHQLHNSGLRTNSVLIQFEQRIRPAWAKLEIMDIYIMSRMRIFVILLGFLLSYANPVHAQSPNLPDVASSTPTPTLVNPANQHQPAVSSFLANWRATLLSSEQALSRSGLDDAELVSIIEEIAKIRSGALALLLKIEPLFKQVKEQLDELGPAPKEDELDESEEISAKRTTLEDNYSRLDGELKASRLIIVRATQIDTQITNTRRQRFVTKVLQPSSSIFDFQMWSGFWRGLDGYWHRLKLLAGDSISVTKSKIDNYGFLAIGLLGAILLIAYLTIFLRRKIQHKYDQLIGTGAGGEIEHETRVQLAGYSFVRKALVPIGAIVLLDYLFVKSGILTARLENLFSMVAFVLAAVILAFSLVRIYLNPQNPSRRLINLPEQNAKSVSRIIMFGILLIAGFRLFNNTAAILISPFEVSLALSAMLALTCMVCVVLVLIKVASVEKSVPSEDPVRVNFVRWGYLNPLFWLGALGGIIALFAGYIALAEFLAWQILMAALIFALLWLCIETLDLQRDHYLNIESDRWRKLSRTSGFSKQAVLQGSVFGFGLMKLSAVIAAATAFMISWGYRSSDWESTLVEAFFGFNIGGLSISMSSMVLAVAIFGVGYFITGAIQNWLRNQFLPTTALDEGLRNSITTIFGYAGLVMAVLLAISAAGFDLSNIAIVAGALSVGIGFGLQSIVNNFFSGLILLAERPIKSGDWIVTSGGQGTVRKTSVRSTEIETFDGATVIIPNSTLITEAVTNWTHHSQKGRIIITIGVGYDSDPEQVREILLECGRSHERVLKRPAPNVFFMDFGADALIFELRAYLANINNSISIKSDLRFSIIKALREAKIEIPYPQRDIHIKSTPQGMVPATMTSAPARSRTTKPKSRTQKPISKPAKK